MKIIFSIILVFFMSFSYGQKGFIGVYLSNSFAISKGFKQFANSYNTVFSSTLSKEIKTVLKPRMSYGVHLGYLLYSTELEIDYNRQKAVTSASFINGGERIFQMRYNMLSFKLTQYLGDEDDKFQVGLGLFLGFGTNNIIAKYKYIDGTESVGLEKPLNGVYTRFQISLGPSLSLKYNINEYFTINGGVDMSFKFAGRSFMEDKSRSKSLSISNNPYGLPLDYQEWLDKQATFDYDVSKYVKGDFHVMSIKLGVIFYIGL